MREIITGAGIFIYPLGLCSFVAVLIIVERLLALRRNRIVPRDLVESIARGEPVDAGQARSSLGRLALLAQRSPDDQANLVSAARVEMNRLERGLVFLEIIISAAPLLGLLGTVTGLVQVFSNIDTGTGLPEPSAFARGVALALTTTVLGLAIAIPTLVANSCFQRKIETFAVELSAILDQVRNAGADSRQS